MLMELPHHSGWAGPRYQPMAQGLRPRVHCQQGGALCSFGPGGKGVAVSGYTVAVPHDPGTAPTAQSLSSWHKAQHGLRDLVGTGK